MTRLVIEIHTDEYETAQGYKNRPAKHTMSDHKTTRMPQHGLDRDYPLLCQYAEKHDFAERMGGCTSQLHQEIDAALRELWTARHTMLEPYRE